MLPPLRLPRSSILRRVIFAGANVLSSTAWHGLRLGFHGVGGCQWIRVRYSFRHKEVIKISDVVRFRVPKPVNDTDGINFQQAVVVTNFQYLFRVW